MKLLKEITIENPPIKYVQKLKQIDPKTKKLKEKAYYLTGNIFYSGINHFLRTKIINNTKMFLIPYFKGIKKADKIRLHFIYCRENENFDLDNKANFWVKIILDILKKPKGKDKKYHCLGVIKDDTVKYIDEIKISYEKGTHKIIIKIYEL